MSNFTRQRDQEKDLTLKKKYPEFVDLKDIDEGFIQEISVD